MPFGPELPAGSQILRSLSWFHPHLSLSRLFHSCSAPDSFANNSSKLTKVKPAVLGRTAFSTLPAKGADRALKLAKEGIRDLLAQQGLETSAIKRIGVSCGGPLDRIQGVIQSPPNLPTWDNVPIKAIMEEEFATECQVENDANAGAVAEHRFGAGQGTQNMVFLTMGTGLGAGIITDGHLYHGANDLRAKSATFG